MSLIVAELVKINSSSQLCATLTLKVESNKSPDTVSTEFGVVINMTRRILEPKFLTHILFPHKTVETRVAIFDMLT